MARFLQTPEPAPLAVSEEVGRLDFGGEMRKTNRPFMDRLRKLPLQIPMATVTRLSDHRRQRRIFFSRTELDQLLQLYSRQVMRGLWRDYAIDQHDGTASFSVFRHSLESPLFTVVKSPADGSRHAGYTLLHRRVRMASGSTLQDVLRKLERELRRSGRLIEAWAAPAPR